MSKQLESRIRKLAMRSVEEVHVFIVPVGRLQEFNNAEANNWLQENSKSTHRVPWIIENETVKRLNVVSIPNFSELMDRVSNRGNKISHHS
jgi:hypothetical protein